jgi:hypothetical protein
MEMSKKTNHLKQAYWEGWIKAYASSFKEFYKKPVKRWQRPLFAKYLIKRIESGSFEPTENIDFGTLRILWQEWLESELEKREGRSSRYWSEKW